MPINSILVCREDGTDLHCIKPFDNHNLLATSNFFEAHGVFRTAIISTATTTNIAEPGLGGFIVVTNILLSAEKKNGGTVAVTFDDGTNTETLFSAILTEIGVQASVNLPHGWRGWADGAIKVVTNSTAAISITVGYVKLNDGEQFSVWNARR